MIYSLSQSYVFIVLFYLICKELSNLNPEKNCCCPAVKGKPFGSSSAYEKTLTKEREKIYLHGNFSAAVLADLENVLKQTKEEQAPLL